MHVEGRLIRRCRNRASREQKRIARQERPDDQTRFDENDREKQCIDPGPVLCDECGKVLIEVDPRYFRPTEVDLLLGDPTKAKEKLGWTHDTSPRDLAREMVLADLQVMKDAPIAKGA